MSAKKTRRVRRLDQDVKAMNSLELRHELTRVRNWIRWHMRKDNNARCWHNDLTLYHQTLPGVKRPGRMTQSKRKLLRNCDRYITGQQCQKPHQFAA